jgi:branched-chain amino acid transport system substrate-binding protein
MEQINSKRNYIKYAVCLAVILLAIATIMSQRSNVGNHQPIKIGSISALTGVGVAVGEEEKHGAELAIEEINRQGGVLGRPLELVSEDLSLDKMKNAALVTNKLISIDKVVAIVGAQWDEPTEAIIPSIEAAHIPTISPDASNHVEIEKDAPYFFSTWYDNRVGIRTILSYAKKHNLKNIYIIRPIDGGFWKFTADLLTQYAPEYGIKIVGDMNLGDPLTTDFRTPIAKVKQVNPDAVFILETDPGKCAFAKQSKELGLTVPILATEVAGDYSSLAQCGELLETTYFSTPIHSTDSYKKFESSYTKKYGRPPQYPSSVTAYDAIYVIASALRETNGASGPALRDAISETKNYPGSSLPYITFDEKGYSITPDNSFEMQTVRDGKFVRID